MIQRPDVTYVEGEPYRTLDHTRVVSSSMDAARAWPSEHGPTGQHDGERFEQAGFVYELDLGQVVESTGIASVTHQSDQLRVELEEPFASPDHWGMMVRVSHYGAPTPILSQVHDMIYPEIVDGRKTGSVGYIKLPLSPIVTARITVVVVGYRRRRTGEPADAPEGSKLIPVRQTAHPSGVGDVVSVEQLNGVVDFAKDLADAIEREHAQIHDGPYVHANPQFAAAAACVEFEWPSDPMDSPVSSRLLWSWGFLRGRAPRLIQDRLDEQWDWVGPPGELELALVRYSGMSLVWALPTTDEQWVDVGYAISQMDSDIVTSWHVRQGESEDPHSGRLKIGEFMQLPEEEPVQKNKGIRYMCRIYLMIRTRAEE